MLWNSRVLTSCFFFNLKSWWYCKYGHTIYNNIFSRLYTSLNCVTSQFTIHSDVRGTSRSSPHHTEQHHPFYNIRACSCFSYLAKHDVFVSLWLASVMNVSPPVNSVGPPRNATDCGIHLVQLKNHLGGRGFLGKSNKLCWLTKWHSHLLVILAK